jgi:hypothetical protein
VLDLLSEIEILCRLTDMRARAEDFLQIETAAEGTNFVPNTVERNKAIRSLQRVVKLSFDRGARG